MTPQGDEDTPQLASDDALLAWLGDRALAESDPRVAMRLICRALASYLGVSRVGYGEVDPDTLVVTVPDEWTDGVGPATGSRQLEAGSAILATFSRGEIVAVPDWHDMDLTPAEQANMRDMGSRAMLVVPLLRDGRLNALFAAMHHEPRDWTADEIALVNRVAAQTRSHMDHVRALSAVRQSEAQFRSLAENMPGICWLAGPDGRAFWMNQVGLDFFGDAGLAEDNAEQIVHPDDYVEVMAAWDAARRDGTMIELTVRTRGRDGIYRPLLSRAQPVRDEAGNIIRWTGVQIDLSEERTRKRAEDFLRSLSERTRDLPDPQGILEVTLDMLGCQLCADRVVFSETPADDPGAFTISHAWAEGQPCTLDGRWRHDDFPLLAAAYRQGLTLSSSDCQTDAAIDDAMRARLAAHGIRSGISVPVIKQGELVAVLSIHCATHRQWSAQEIRLAEDAAERTWSALTRARAERVLIERERSQALLLAWSDSVRNESKPRAILAKTLAAMGEHLGVQRVNFAERDETGSGLRVDSEWVNGLASVVGACFPYEALGQAVYAAHLAGGAFQTDDAHQDPRFDPQTLDLYDSVGARAFISIPRIRDGQLLAVLSVQQSTPRRWSEADVRLMLDIADRTWTILDRAMSEERLAESEALLAGFLENAPIAMYLKDADGRYIRVNAEMGRVMGLPPEAAIGRTAREVTVPEVADRVAELDRDALLHGVQSSELTIPGRDTLSSLLSIRFPIATGDGRPVKLGGFTIDLTEQKKAETALRTSREALFQSEKLNALGSLLAGVSHELNNPLSIVVAQAVMLERQTRGTELADRGHKIRKAADRCAHIVQTFLAMARQKQPEREAVDLNAVATAALELTGYVLKTDGIQVETALADALPAIAADRDQLHQVIINLIVNAQQSMAGTHGVPRRLTVRTARGPAKRTVTLDVVDSGPGVPAEVARRIFEPFFTTKPEGQGTGVGLSFSQGLAEAHGGRLELVPSTDGAHFRLTLPVDACPPIGMAAAEDAVDDEPAPRTALIVDDEREIAESLADFLSLEGFACDIVIGGAAAQARLSDRDYDLIVSDLRMPGIDGPQLYAWLCAQRPSCNRASPSSPGIRSAPRRRASSPTAAGRCWKNPSCRRGCVGCLNRWSWHDRFPYRPGRR